MNELTNKIKSLRSAITSSNIIQLYYTASRDSISFLHIWNNIIVMLQHPLSFYVCHKVDDDYELLYRVNRDPLSNVRFTKLWASFNNYPVTCEEAKENHSGGEDEPLKYKEGYLFKIFDTNYYMLLVSVYDVDSQSGSQRRMRLIGNSDWQRNRSKAQKKKTSIQLDYIAKQLENFFSWDVAVNTKGANTKGANIEQIQAERLRDFITKSLEDTIEVSNDTSSIGFKSRKLDSEDNDSSKLIDIEKSKYEMFRDVMIFNSDNYAHLARGEYALKSGGETEQDFAGQGYLSRVYKKMKGGLLSLKEQDGAYLTNMYLTIVDCADSSGLKRCPPVENKEGVYDYRARLYLTQEQLLELSEHIEKNLISKSVFLNQYKEKSGLENVKPTLYSDIKETISDSDKNKGFIVEALNYADNWFWGCVEKEKGVSEILEVLQSPFGKRLRSLADAAFWNRTVHFTNVFYGGGVARCFGGSKDSNLPATMEGLDAVIINDIKRICTTYYYFRAMMSRDKREELDRDCKNKLLEIGLMQVPMEVQGSSFIVGSNLVFLKPGIDHYAWLRNVDVYNAVSQKMKRAIRRSYKDLYFDVIEQVFVDNYYYLINQIQNCAVEALPSIEDMEDILNDSLDIIESVVPFKTIRLKIYIADKDIKEPKYEKNSESNVFLRYFGTKSGKNALKWLTRDLNLKLIEDSSGVEELDENSTEEFKLKLMAERGSRLYKKRVSFDLLPNESTLKVLVTLEDNRYFSVPTKKTGMVRFYLRPEEVKSKFKQKTKQAVYLVQKRDNVFSIDG